MFNCKNGQARKPEYINASKGDFGSYIFVEWGISSACAEFHQ